MNIIVHTDGGARGNPGPAGVGVVIEIGGEITKFGKRIGETTNNVAEYQAVIEALESLKYQVSSITQDEIKIQFFLDSTLVVNQLNGIFKIKEPHLRTLLLEVKSLEQEVGGVIGYQYVPREQNKEADFLVNQALDGKI